MTSRFTKLFTSILIALFSVLAVDGNAFSSDTTILKGSYLFYVPPFIEDNSIYIDEALNQSPRSLQFASTMLIKKISAEYQLEVEVPLAGEKHQMSFSLPVTLRSFRGSSVGDFQVTYRPLLLGKNRWCLLTPAFTLILPTEKSNANGCGGEVKVALTKRLMRTVTVHVNLGGSAVMGRKPNESSDVNSTVAIPSKQNALVGTGVVWAATRNFNLMIEQVYSGSRSQSEVTINPAMRFAFAIGKHQLVPAIGFPANFSNGAFQGCNAMFYLSIETGN